MAISMKPSISLMFFLVLFLMVKPNILSAARTLSQFILKRNLNHLESGGSGGLRTQSHQMIGLSAIKVDDINFVKVFHLHVLTKGIIRGSGPSHKGHKVTLSSPDKP